MKRRKPTRIDEDVKMSDVRDAISDKVKDTLEGRAFQRKVREIVADALEDYFKFMYNRRGFWKSELT